MKTLLTAWLAAVVLGFALLHSGSAQVTDCGNGLTDAGETCDDNNTVTGDGCSDSCQVELGFNCSGTPSSCFSTCGDGSLASDESCDDNNTLTGDGCSDSCQVELGFNCSGTPSLCFSTCGDGSLASDESCDDNNLMPGDGCSDSCQVELGFNCSGTPSSCFSTCGDGSLASDESCDDDNLTPGDGCSDSCQVETGFNCTGSPSVCLPLCGDGSLVSDESCDDNNTVTGDGCSDSCQVETGFNCSGTPSVCLPICGDGLIMSPEGCDDNNTVSNDGCFSTCLVETGFSCTGTPSVCLSTCGDGIVASDEECDDNNVVPNDGCSDFCRIDFGYACTGSPSICVSTCGDGQVASDEACDDGDLQQNDGCSQLCQVEDGYTCSAGSPSVCEVECGDGLRFGLEECDDGMSPNSTGDGCANCLIEDNFICEEDGNGLSMCVAVLLDLNVPDNTTLSYSSEYFDLDEVVYLSDPNNTNMTSFFVSQLGGDWTAIYVVALNGVERISFQVDVFVSEAEADGRIPSTLNAFFTRRDLFTDDPRLSNFAINASDVISGMQVTGDSSHPQGDGNSDLSSNEIDIALRSIGYIARQHPGYRPREFCLIAEDSLYNTIACTTLYFIGRNDLRPEIAYSPNSIVSFVEGQRDFVSIVDGSLTVTDDNHPTRYPMQSARASILDFTPGYPEQLSVYISIPGSFSYQFDESSGVLVITGNETADVYSSILSNITYHNNMTEPLGDSRTIQLSVSDGVGYSNVLDVQVAIVNVNDEPSISLIGEVPIIRNQSVTYTEGRGARRLTPGLVVVDTDPDAMIQQVSITLTNPIDADFEVLNLTANLTGTGINLSRSPHRLELVGVASRQVYTNVLRTWTYEHSDANPGNPTVTPARLIDFFVQDDQNASNILNSTLYVTIAPVNDPPILLYFADPAGRLVLSGETIATFMYLEDGPPINIGQDIYLRDVDSDISSAVLELTGLLNGEQDRIYFASLAYGIVANETAIDGGNRTLSLSGVATFAQYEEVLQSLTYWNIHMNDSVADGRRSITIVTSDVMGLESGLIYAHVDVMDRNDGPRINLGGGVDMDYEITYIENGNSIPIAESFLSSIMDEEGHNISRLTLEIMSPNGNLDPSDSIFFRTPGGLPFLSNLDAPFTTQYISISLNATPSAYLQAVNSIYYVNSEDEPTQYNSSERDAARLMRVIVVSITDSNFIDPNTNAVDATDADLGVSTTIIRIGVRITPINDNRPLILINTDPPSCSTDSRDMADTEVSTSRRRRDVRSMSRIHKKSVLLSTLNEQDYSMAPKLISVCPTFTNTSQPSKKCLKQILLTFNANTNTPVVEVPLKLDNLISFDPPGLNSAAKFGLWLDHKTMVVRFVECVEVEVETTSGKPRPMFVAFEAERGDCDWSTPCSHGVCFNNGTGCPVVSYTNISPDTSNCHVTDTRDDTPNQTPAGYIDSRFGPLVIMFIIISLILISLILVCKQSFSSRRRQQESPKRSVVVQLTPVKTHVQELIQVSVDPQLHEKETKSPPITYPVTPLADEAPGSQTDKKTETPPPTEPHTVTPSPRRSPQLTKLPKEGEKTKKGFLPKAKRKPPLEKDTKQTTGGEAVEDVSASCERLQGVPMSLSCDQSHDQQRSTVAHSNSTVLSHGKEQSINNHHTGDNRRTTTPHRERTTLQANGSHP